MHHGQHLCVVNAARLSHTSYTSQLSATENRIRQSAQQAMTKMFHPLASWRPLPMDGDEDTASTRPVQGPLPARTAPQPFQPRSFTCVSSSQLTERYRDMVGARSLYLFRLFVSVGTISRTQQHLLFAGAIRRLTGTPGALGVRFKNRMDRWGGDSKRARPLITVFQVHPSLRHKAINAQTRSDATSKRSSTHACLCGIASGRSAAKGGYA